MRRVNLMLDDETVQILDRMTRATGEGARMNRSSLVRALTKGADVLPDPVFAVLRSGEEDLAFLVRAFLSGLAQREEASRFP